MNSFNLFRLDEGRAPRQPRYISETEFQFIYDCLHGKYKGITSNTDKEKLEEKIVKFLDVKTVFSEDKKEYGNCKAAQEHFKRLKKENPGNEKLVNVQLFCSDKIPKFMNVYIQKIFENIEKHYTDKDDPLLKTFISVHLDAFIQFFKSREEVDTVSITPKGKLYQELVEMYSEKYKEGKVLSSFEFDNPADNYILKIFKYYLDPKESQQEKSKSYIYQDCKLVNTNIGKLICALTHRRDTKDSFKFERGFEHSNQFIPYKGNVNYQISTLTDLNGALYIDNMVDANSENTVKQVVSVAYANTITVMLKDINVKNFYTENCQDQNNNLEMCLGLNDNIRNKIKLIFTKSVFLQIEKHNKMTKGDIMVDNPVSECSGEKSEVLAKGNILELKYFTEDVIRSSKKERKLHITRILEPEIPKILKTIKESGLPNDYVSNPKFFKKFLEKIIDVIIEATKDIVKEDFDKIINTFDSLKGIIIDGPKYIEKTEGWKFLIESGKTGQQGRGVAIVLQLPEDFIARELKYVEEENLFCFAN
jgi:hypothetical protein